MGQNIVIVGGGAEFPGMRPRVEFEVRELLREKEHQGASSFFKYPDEVYVLNPPTGKRGPLTTPRFIPLFGGCVRAASSLNLDEPLQPLAMPIEEDDQFALRNS